MEVDAPMQDEFMEIEDDEHGWSEEDDEDYQHCQEPEFINNDSNYQAKLTSGFNFTIISEQEIIKKKEDIINSTMEVLGIEEELAQKLLIKQRFNKDEVIQIILEKDLDKELEINTENCIDRSNDEHTCLVWFWEYPEKELVIAPCDHFLCKTWYYYYLLTAVKSGPQCIRTTCPINKWNDLISPSIFKTVLSAQEHKMYDKFFLTYFVDCMKSIKWCPSPGCSKAVFYPEITAVDVFCTWGKAFWFYWEQDAHTPVECYYLQMFMDKLREGEQDGLTTTNDLWVKVNSKNCPKCKVPIEKNSGCMHMTCYSCRYDFCWLCMGDYKKHQEETGIGLCNSFEDVKKVNRAKEGEMKERNRLDMKMRKFLHYATRYKEHLNSVQLDRVRGEQLKSQIEFIISKSKNRYTPIDFEFIKDIINLVCKARRALANSYSMRFFMTGRRKKAFFDFIQADLEMSLEVLSGWLIKDITEYIEMSSDKSISLKESFFKFKTEAWEVRNAVETHFSKILIQIKGNFPDVKEDEKNDDSGDDSSDEESGPKTDAKVEWTWYICTSKNLGTSDKCNICQAPRSMLNKKA